MTARRAGPKTEHQLEAFFSHALTPLVILDRDLRFVRVNEAYAKACGRSVDDFPGRGHFEFYPHPENEAIFAAVVRDKKPYVASAKPFSFPDHPEWGTTYWDWTLTPILDAQGEVDFLVFSLVDVTERVRAETELRRRADELDDLYNHAACGYHSLGPDGTYLRVNDTELSWLGAEREEVVGRKKFTDFLDPAGVKTFRAEFPAFKERGWLRDLEFDLVRADGSRLPVLVSATAVKDEFGRFVMSRSVMYDNTDRKRAEEARSRLAAMVEGSDDAIVGETLDGVVVSWNEGARRLYGWSAEEMVGRRAEVLYPPELRGEEGLLLSRIRAGEHVAHHETDRVTKDGRRLRVSRTLSPVRDAAGWIVGASSVGRDMTARWEAERAVARLTRTMRTLSLCNQALVRAADERDLLGRACRIIVDGGYRMCWVGYRVDDAAKSVKPVASAGPEEGYLAGLNVTWADGPLGRGPTGRCIREGAVQSCRDILNDPAFEPWREEALKRGYRASLSLPLLAEGKAFGALMIYAADPKAFDDEEVELLKELSDDLAYGVTAHRAEAARVQAEAALRRSESDLTRAQAVAKVGSWSLDVAKDELTWSAETYRMFGVPPGTALDYAGFLARVHPDDRAAVDAAWSAALARAPYDIEHRIVVDGETRWVRERAELEFDAAGRVARGIGTVQDVTERRRADDALRLSEARYHRLFDSSKDGLLLLDAADLTVLAANPALLLMLGAPPDAAVGRKLTELEAFADAASSEPGLAELGRRDHARFEDLVLKARDGREVVVDLVANAYPVDGARLVQCSARDVTEQRRLRAQVLHAQKMESVGVLAGGVAHDFNNVLMTIMANCSFLLGELAPDDPRRAEVAEIQAAGERAAALTRQLLIFSRKQAAQPRTLDLDDLLRNLQKMLVRVLGEDVQLAVELGVAPALVRADPGQLEQVVMNLAVNARDAMPRGGRLALRTRRLKAGEEPLKDCVVREPAKVLRLEVEDSGVGMTREVLSHLFEPFFTTKAVGKGTGLGLSTVYGIVRQAGGGVEARSSPGAGSTFTVDLPEAEAAAAPAPPAAAAAAARAGGGETILLVEDDEMLRRIDVRLLEEHGYKVHAARDGETALALLRGPAKDADLLLTDVVMPGIGGAEVAREALRLRPDLPVIFVSGYAEHAALEPVQKGRCELLQKPVAPEVLAAKVRESLDKRPTRAS